MGSLSPIQDAFLKKLPEGPSKRAAVSERTVNSMVSHGHALRRYLLQSFGTLAEPMGIYSFDALLFGIAMQKSHITQKNFVNPVSKG